MPNLATIKLRIHSAEQFQEAFNEASPTFMYMTIGKVAAWPNESSPPSPSASISEVEYEQWRSMLAAKRINASDVKFVIPRYNWTSNTVYREYSSEDSSLFDTPLNSNTFYVVNDSLYVYKCIFNNRGSSSTVQPTGTSSSIISTSDGYRWKFMYAISAADELKFVTNSYVPVETLTANNGSAQWTIQQSASNGSIEVIDVISAGNNYLTDSNTFLSISNSSIVQLANSASLTDDIYNGSTLYISSGLGSGQIKEIVNYVGSSRTVTLNSGFSVSPNTSSSYLVGPKITITGDGTGATAYANVASSRINYVNMISTGQNYSRASVTVTANTSHGDSANVVAYVSPKGGHGSDPLNELGGYNVLLNVQFSGNESNTFPVTNDFRKLSLLKNPLLSNGISANSSTYDQTTRLTLTSVSGSGRFLADEIITGAASSATARVVSFANTNSGNTAGVLSVVSSNNTFSNSEIISGNTSSVTGVLGGTTLGSLKPNSGEFLYIENRTAIARAVDQTEDVKLVIQF